jgi:hypothetical protein
MPEYVYALFDFVPENPDEIHFKAGDRIEVVERDDVYSDGWWQVSSCSIGQTFPFCVGTLAFLGFAFGGCKCTGREGAANA